MPFDYAETVYHCHDFPADLRVAPDVEVAALSTAGEGYVGFNGNRRFRSLTRDMTDLLQIGVDKGIVQRASQADPLSLGNSPEGRRICALVIGSQQNQPHKVLVVGGTHAREWIAVEVPFLLAKFLIDTYPAPNTQPAAWTAQQRRVKHLVDNREIWIAPLVNPDGHEYSRFNDRTWRKNRRAVVIGADRTVIRHWDRNGNPRVYTIADPGAGTALNFHGNHNNYHVNRASWVLDPACVAAPCANHDVRQSRIAAGTYYGVDINRNFPSASRGVLTGRKVGGEDGDPVYSHGFLPDDEDYCGPGVTEPETQILVNLMNAQNFEALLTYHNFSELILVPDAAHANARVKELAAHISDLIATQGGTYRVALSQALYPTTGDMIEWAYETFPGLPAYTIELSPAADDAAHGFSLLADDQIPVVFRQNLRAALAVINCAPHQALTPPNLAQAIPDDLVGASPLQAVRNCWRVFTNF